MNAKLLTDEALRDDLYLEMMFTAGTLAFYGVRGDKAREVVEKQIDLMLPVIKRHIKRRIKAAKEIK